MKKVLTATLALLTLMSPALAQQEVEIQFTGTPWGVQNVSANNRYLVGTRQYTEFYRYDMVNKELITVQATHSQSDMAGLDVTNDGVVVGKDDDLVPAIYKDGAWHKLPILEGKLEGPASACSANGEVITGQVYGTATDKPYKVYPMVWYQQTDGNYTYEVLPDPEVDFLGGKTQFNSPRAISADGNTIYGVQVEQKGRYFTNIVYTRGTDGKWTLSMPLVKYCYNTDRFKELQAEEPQLKDYVSQEGDYMENVNRYLLDQARWQLKIYTEGMTGLTLNAVPVVSSQDGRYLALASQRNTYELVEENPSVEVKAGPIFPSLYDTHTGELITMEQVTDFSPFAISNQGDMIYSDGVNFMLLLRNSQQPINVVDFLKEKYNFDLRAALPSNTQYIESAAIGNNLEFLAGTYRSVTPDGELDAKEVFCVMLPQMTDIIESLNTPASNSIKLEGNQLVFDGPMSNIRIYDMGGRQTMQASQTAHKLNVQQLETGVYIVTAHNQQGTLVKGRVLKQ